MGTKPGATRAPKKTGSTSVIKTANFVSEKNGCQECEAGYFLAMGAQKAPSS